MTVSRVLPARLAPRFAGAPRAMCKVETASFEVVIAERFFTRLRGLAGLGKPDLVPLLFPRTRSLHTFGMRAPIDVVWLGLGPDGEGEVLAIQEAVAPRRAARAPRGSDRSRTAALELAARDAQTLGLRPGAHVELTQPG